MALKDRSDAASATESRSVGLKRVCVIDDDPINNLICESLLKKTGYALDVKSFPGAAEALNWLGAEAPEDWPELILLDINMPGIDGWGFLARFAALPGAARVPVYILSSSVSQDDLDRAAAQPLVKGYLSKPLRREDLPVLQSA